MESTATSARPRSRSRERFVGAVTPSLASRLSPPPRSSVKWDAKRWQNSGRSFPDPLSVFRGPSSSSAAPERSAVPGSTSTGIAFVDKIFQQMDAAQGDLAPQAAAPSSSSSSSSCSTAVTTVDAILSATTTSAAPSVVDSMLGPSCASTSLQMGAGDDHDPESIFSWLSSGASMSGATDACEATCYPSCSTSLSIPPKSKKQQAGAREGDSSPLQDFLDGFLNGEDWGGARATSNAAPGATVAGVGTTGTAEIEAAKSRSVGRQETRFDAAAGSTTAAVEAARLAAIATADALAESVTKNESTSASASAIAASTDDITAMLGLEEILGRRVHQHNGNGEGEEGQSKASATAAKKGGEISGAETVDSLMAWMLSDPSWLDDAARARSWSGRGVAGKGCFRPDLPIGGSASSRSSSLAAARGAAFLYAGKNVGCAPTGRLESNNDFNVQLRSRSCDSGSGGSWNSAQDMFFPAVNNIFNASGATSKGQGGEWCGGKYGKACSSHGTAIVMRRGGAKGSAFAPIGGPAINRTGRADPYSSCYATSAAVFDGKGNGGATTSSNSNSMFVGGSSIAGGTTCSGVRGHYGGGKGSQPAGKGSNYSSGLHPFDASASQTSFGQSSHLYRGGAGAGAPPGLVPHSGGYSRRGKNYTTICRVDFVGRGDFEVPPELGPVPYVRRNAPPLVREQSEAGAYKDPADLPFAFDADMQICAESSSKAGTSPAEGGGGNGRDRSGRAATEVSGPGDGSSAGGAAAEASAAPARAGGPTAGCTATDKDSDHDGGDTIPGRTVLTKERGGLVADAQKIQPAFGNGIQQPPAPALPRGLMRGNAARHCVPMQPAASRTFHPIERRARPVLPPPPGILPPPARNSAKNKSTGSSARGSPEDLRQPHVVGDPFADVAAIAFEDVNMGVSLTASLASSSSQSRPPQKRPLHPSPSLLLESPSLAAAGQNQKLQQAKKEVEDAGAEGAPGRAAGSTTARPLPPLPLLLTDTSDENRGDKKPKIKSTDLDLAAVKGTTGECAGNDDAERPQDDSSPQTTTDDQTPEDRAGKPQCEHEPKAQGSLADCEAGSRENAATVAEESHV